MGDLSDTDDELDALSWRDCTEGVARSRPIDLPPLTQTELPKSVVLPKVEPVQWDDKPLPSVPAPVFDIRSQRRLEQVHFSSTCNSLDTLDRLRKAHGESGCIECQVPWAVPLGDDSKPTFVEPEELQWSFMAKNVQREYQPVLFTAGVYHLESSDGSILVVFELVSGDIVQFSRIAHHVAGKCGLEFDS